MKKFFFKTGIVLEFVLLLGHLYSNRHGLPIPVIDEDSRLLTYLMKTYKIQYSIGKHTLDQTITGYDLTWAAFVVFTFLTSILILRSPQNLKKGRAFTGITTLLWLACLIAGLLYWSPPQQIPFGLLFLSFLISYLFEWNQPHPKDTRICVVGAGISGLTAAYELQKKGYSHITVLEKAEEVGGKCISKIVKWHPFDLGGHEMLAGYTDALQMADELGAPTRASIPPMVYNHDTKQYLNFKQAATISGKFTLFQVIVASVKYLFLVATKFRNFSKPATGYKNVPEELNIPLEEWLEKRNLLALTDILSFVVKVQGYGHFRDTSAAYLVKFMGFQNWLSLLVSGMGLSKKWPRVFTLGMLNLCQRIAATIPDVRVNTNILKIERHTAPRESLWEGGVKIYIDGQSDPLVFDKLILSTSLELSNLGFLDLTKTEQGLFQQIKFVRFFTTLCEVQGLPAGVVASIPLNNINKGEYTGYIKDFTDAPFASFFSLADSTMTGQYIEEEINRVLKRIPSYGGQDPKVLRVLEQKDWKYFPYVAPPAVAAGFYNQLEALQGENQTYFASSLLSFECVGNCVAYTKRLITKNF